MNRRTLLAALGATGIAGSSGCLGDQTHDDGVLDVQRSGSTTADECDEQELLDGYEVLANIFAPPLEW